MMRFEQLEPDLTRSENVARMVDMGFEKLESVIGSVTQVVDDIDAATFERESGCLRFLRNERLVVKLMPPHSWTLIASISNNAHWGTRPSEQDLALVLNALRTRYPVRSAPDRTNGIEWVQSIVGTLKRYVFA